MGEQQITVAATPDALAQAQLPGPGSPRTFFVLPLERKLRVAEALSQICQAEISGGEEAEVLYVQHQNDSLTSQFEPLMIDITDHLSLWARAAFGTAQEATNFWLGNSRSSTSYHQDYYENIYCMVRGCKHFRLLAPCQKHRMDVRSYPVARYKESAAGLHPVLLSPAQSVPWSSVRSREPAAGPGCRCHPCWPTPLHVTVRAGEVLYLPACTWHHVSQSAGEEGCAIAVNYWFDVASDKLLSLLATLDQ
ncbi:hypothetical protein WJX72_003410 [[Myrmecia] bisecta]|uniref:JmjC domain-containing protein n=1 Tax=[Myrmecia] bisecta TaxID=41462 RepID=A0AAW1R689_9CHLO